VAKKLDSGSNRQEAIDVDAELEWIKKNKDKCVAIGECGLDYKWVTGKEKEQQKIFLKVIDTVEKLANVDLDALINLKGIGKATAEKIRGRGSTAAGG